MPDRAQTEPARSLWDRLRDDTFALRLIAIALVGFALRVVYVVSVRDRPVLVDGWHYHRAALGLVDGRGFTNPLALELFDRTVADAVHPPAWTLLLAVPSALGLRSPLSHQLLACAIGAATVVMCGLAGRAAFGRRAGLIAALMIAIYPNAWMYERELLSEPLAMLGVATMLWLAYRFHAGPGTVLAVSLGVMVGLLAMTRAEMLAISIFLVTPLILSARHRSWRRRFEWLAMSGVACVLVIAPWGIYNTTRFERPVPLSTNAGATLLAGNCAPTYEGELLGHYTFACLSFVRDISDDPSVADVQYRDTALDFMRDRPSRVPIVVAARAGRTIGVFRPAQQVEFEGERGTSLWVIRSVFVSYWVLLPLAVAGALVARRRRIPIYPLLAFPLTVLIAVTLTVGSVRYRAPSDLCIILLAALAIDAALTRWRRRRAAEDSPPPDETAHPSPALAVGEPAP